MKIVITGTNRGLGIHLAKTALERGHTVLAGVRTVQEKSPITLLKDQYPDCLHIYYLDVTKEESIIEQLNLLPRMLVPLMGLLIMQVF